MSVTVVNWNVAWARPGTPRGEEILRRIAAARPHVICLTEANLDFLPSDGYLIASAADYGYNAPKGRRKALLWSRCPWENVDTVGSATLPEGRFVAGTTATDAGPLRFIAVCVPWRDAHVHTGRRDRRPWEDHITYLQGLIDLLGKRSLDGTILLGDFNQTLPRTRAPLEAYRLLRIVSGLGLNFVTDGLLGERGTPTIDHVAVGPGLTVSRLSVLSNDGPDKQLSDHYGIVSAIA